jgi:ABC-type polysaccharide/polyol phosphate transport system ATPase subunit
LAKNCGDVILRKLIELNDVSVNYLIRHGASPTLKETIIKSIRREKQDVEVKALSNVSFSVSSGEVLAVIGRNGAGKSTLLKLLARVLPPTTGRVQVTGYVAPMIELGAGFNGELTGRENVILYGTLLGRKPKEMEEKVDRIASWADIKDSIDLPLRTYSSGMVAKLAFAVATDKPLDVILVDEVLSVGDAEFQTRSKARMRELFQRDSAVVLVSHDTDSIRELATKAIWIDHGIVKKYGEVNSVLDSYLNA